MTPRYSEKDKVDVINTVFPSGGKIIWESRLREGKAIYSELTNHENAMNCRALFRTQGVKFNVIASQSTPGQFRLGIKVEGDIWVSILSLYRKKLEMFAKALNDASQISNDRLLWSVGQFTHQPLAVFARFSGPKGGHLLATTPKLRDDLTVNERVRHNFVRLAELNSQSGPLMAHQIEIINQLHGALVIQECPVLTDVYIKSEGLSSLASLMSKIQSPATQLTQTIAQVGLLSLNNANPETKDSQPIRPMPKK